MSETDSFIDEVSEEVRRDRMFRLWKKYGWYVIGAMALFVALVGLKEYLDYQATQARRAVGAALLQAEATEDPAARAAAYEALADGEEGGAALIARMRAAGAFAEAGETGGALEILEAIASDASLGRAYTDMARLKVIGLTAGDMAPDALLASLEPLIEPNAPYRLLALEARANALLALDDLDGARADLREIQASGRAPQGLATRVRALLLIIGDGVEAS